MFLDIEEDKREDFAEGSYPEATVFESSPNRPLSTTPNPFTASLEEQESRGYADTPRLGVQDSDGNYHSLSPSDGQSVVVPNTFEQTSDRIYRSPISTDGRGVESLVIAGTIRMVDPSSEVGTRRPFSTF